MAHQSQSALSGFRLRDVDRGYVFTPTPAEIAQRCLHVIYNPGANTYYRVTDGNRQTNDYLSCVYESHNMYRKEEPDWKMVYLARDVGNHPGDIAWRFDFRGTGLVIEDVTIAATAKTYKNGTVVWKVLPDTPSAVRHLLIREAVNPEVIGAGVITGHDTAMVRAELTGGEGNDSYQAAQLFRMGLRDYSKYPFDIKIRLKSPYGY